MFTVYMHVNKTNNKKYIGITSQKPEDRWGPDGCHYSSQYFARAIQKYGWDGFDHLILCEDLDEDEAKELEIILIEEHNTFDANFGYNCTRGGDGNRKYKTDEESHQARLDSAARKRAKTKADPEKYQYRLAQMRKIHAQYRADPVLHEKLLESNRQQHIKKRSTPEGRAEDNAASYKVKCDVKQIRKELKELYQEHPDLFSDEDFKIVFDRRQTPNKSWVFTYTSKNALSKILIKVKENIKTQYETNT